MPTVDYRSPIQCLAAVRGHPFDRNGFAALFEGMEGIAVTMVDQPAAARLMNPEGMAGFDVLILYDMPGLDFDAPDNPPHYVDPPDGLREGLTALCEQGTGILALHHALAGWPAWPGYGEMLGGRFFYHPGEWLGQQGLDSGYAHEVDYELEVVADHPVTHGVSPRFAVTDEPYLAEIDEAGVTPLLRSSHSYTRDNFYSADLAVRGSMYSREGWDHPAGSNLACWTKKVGNSDLVYLQPGDSPQVFQQPDYRRLVENAIRWLASS